MLGADATDDLEGTLHALRDVGAVPSLWVEYRAVVVSRLRSLGAPGSELRRAYSAFLVAELQYHLRPGNFQGLRDVEDYGTAGGAPVAERRAARALLAAVERLEVSGDPERAARHLILAEAHCHLRQLAEATWHLESAAAAGAQEPVVHLAIGCCRCSVAAAEFTRSDETSGLRTIMDSRRYRMALLDAVSALESGLTGGRLDSVLYWWMGVALEEAGFAGASQLAWAHADGAPADVADLAPGRPFRGRGLDHETQAWYDEMRQVAQALKGRFTVAEVLGQ